jgi:hypothetical protein
VKIAFTVEELMQRWQAPYYTVTKLLYKWLACGKIRLYRESAGKLDPLSPDEIGQAIRGIDHWGAPLLRDRAFLHALTLPYNGCVRRLVNCDGNYAFFVPQDEIRLSRIEIIDLERAESDEEVRRRSGASAYKSPIKLPSRSELMEARTPELVNATNAALLTEASQPPQSPTTQAPASEPVKRERNRDPRAGHCERCRKEAKDRWDKGSELNLADMARDIAKWCQKKFNKVYTHETFVKWLRPVYPAYEPGKPGAKNRR